MLKISGKVLTVCRKTTPALRTSAARDFFEILRMMNLYSEDHHNKTNQEYFLNGNLVEFVGLDQPQKKRGSKRSWLWLNEANEFTYEDYFQLLIRTTEKIVFDYNPSDEYHWIYDKVLTRGDCELIKSNYRDNPFLEKALIDEIERLQFEDENYWKIYGLGEIGKAKQLIYSNWSFIDEFPESVDEIVYGIDFGFNNPSVLLKIGVKDRDNLFLDQRIYQRQLTNSQFIELLKEEIPDELRDKRIKADSAEPDRIEEIKQAGFNIEGVEKKEVKKGIDRLKRKKLFVTRVSIDVEKELKSYKWKQDKDGRILDEPLKFNDHSMDALRYGYEALEGDEPSIRFL